LEKKATEQKSPIARENSEDGEKLFLFEDREGKNPRGFTLTRRCRQRRLCGARERTYGFFDGLCGTKNGRAHARFLSGQRNTVEGPIHQPKAWRSRPSRVRNNARDKNLRLISVPPRSPFLYLSFLFLFLSAAFKA
jgi:hypothetical protein